MLMFALSEYFQRKPEQRSFTFDELAFGPIVPVGLSSWTSHLWRRSFDRLADRTSGAWQLETAGYQQVLVTEEVDGMKLLDSYYQNAVIGKVGADR